MARSEEYLPVITLNRHFSWKAAYQQYCEKKDAGWAKPFFEKLHQPQLPHPLITPKSDEVHYELLKNAKESELLKKAKESSK